MYSADVNSSALFIEFEENAYWDFRALVVNDNQSLAVKDALLFLRIIHGDKFSTAHWQQFLVTALILEKF